MKPDEIAHLARARGISLEFENARGELVRTSTEVQTKLLQAMGSLSADGSPIETSAATVPAAIVLTGKDGVVELDLGPYCQEMRIAWRLSLENGKQIQGVVGAERSDGDRHIRLTGIPPGYHQLELGDVNSHTTLIVTSGECWLPDSYGHNESLFGISLQLYLVRSSRNWGIGDFTDLKNFIALAAKQGCNLVGLNPLHQMFLDKPEDASPYSPASRRFLNILYIDVEAIPEFRNSVDALKWFLSDQIQQNIAQCRSTRLLDYSQVNSLKLHALRLAFQNFETSQRGVRYEQFETFVRVNGEALATSSFFQVLRNHFSQSPQAAWKKWPRNYGEAKSEEYFGDVKNSAREIRFLNWTQWIADQQLAECQCVAAGAGMRIGIYRDLAVGCDRSGVETWYQPEAFLHSVKVGAPPDLLNPSGQDWGLPPLNPLALQREAYRPFIELLRANMRHAGGLRIDHVMALQRLYWIPTGSQPNEGAYVDYPMDDLIGIIALESQRHRCLVVGEDLGTVPHGFRERMQKARVLSYKVVFFEQDHDSNFVSPKDYPKLAAAVLGSHDLPTLRGWLAGHDIELKNLIGLCHSPDESESQHRSRQKEREHFMRAIGPIDDPCSDNLIAAAAHRFLGRTEAYLALAQLDDILGELEPVNVPTTSSERPNWRRKYAVKLEEMDDNFEGWRLLRAVSDDRKGVIK